MEPPGPQGKVIHRWVGPNINAILSDPETRTIIDKLAEFVARNGTDFEAMTKQKQLANPKFGFLYGGEHYNYYKHRVCMEQRREYHNPQHPDQCKPELNFSVGATISAGSLPIDGTAELPSNEPRTSSGATVRHGDA